MSDNKEFWIVVGTAAPVLLVSSVVAIGQAFDLAVDEGVAEAPVRVQIGERIRIQPILKAAFAAGISALADFVALLFALIDLDVGRALIPRGLGIAATCCRRRIPAGHALVRVGCANPDTTRVRPAAPPTAMMTVWPLRPNHANDRP